MRLAVLWLILLSGVVFGLGLGTPAITDADEAYYAEASREMVERGDYLTPRFNYRERFQKPVLYYWATSAAYRLFGVREWTARAGAALSGLALVLLTFAAGRRWGDQALGLLAGAVVATSFGAVFVARMALPDLPLAFFISATVYALLVALFDRPPHRARWWVASGVAAGLGFLTKGPVALAIPALVLAVPFVLERGWQHLRARDLALAAAAFALVGVPWYAAMTAEHGTRYLRGFFIGDNLERFATTAYNPHRSLFFYVPIVLGGMLPWSPFFLLGIRPALSAWRARRLPRRLSVRLLCWSLVPFLLFSVSVGKQPRYILPMLPPLGLGLALWIRQAAGPRPTVPGTQPTLFRALSAAAGALLLLLAALLWRAQPLLVNVPPGRRAGGLVALAVAAGAVILIPFTRRWRLAPLALVLAGSVMVVVLNQSVQKVRGLYPVEQMARAVLTERQAGEPVGPYRVFVRNLIFYTGLEQEDLFNESRLHDFLRRPGRVLCILHEDDLRALRSSGWTTLRPLHTVTYFEPATAKLRTLLSPDPERDLQTVVLVSNR
ncbi:MAG TPA: glycosyltransferase family 39 protein [Vicinamibacterales bacterium]|nr:glycosyltransferase family 39 protein [Vicinamibacterales bacterium]